MNLSERAKQLRAKEAELGKAFMSVAEAATKMAIEAAAEATPPLPDRTYGTGTITGQLKEHWATDSQTKAGHVGEEYRTTLANDMEYASFVNDGHRMDRHFVPGLYVNPGSGLLEYDPAANVGLVVGTKTSYVKGLKMTRKGIAAYRKAAQKGLRTIKKVVK